MSNSLNPTIANAAALTSFGQTRLSRREVLKAGIAGAGLCLAGISFGAAPQPAQSDEELVAFLDMPRTGENQLDWEMLKDWLTPQNQAFNVQHYGIPEFDERDFKLEITGLVKHPRTLTMRQVKAQPRKDQLMTLECSGNGSSKGFMNAIYNSRWTGTPLGPLLKQCQIDPRAKEIVFLGMDRKKETLRPGTDRQLTIEVPFGRSLSIEDAMNLPVLLAYERNGAPLEKRNGSPLRLIVPGWYGIACVKWLTRIEVRNKRYMGRFMGRDYVTVRGERHGNEVVYFETSVGRMNLKSVVAQVTRRPTEKGAIPLKAYGAAWSDGTDIKTVEVQLDGGPWRTAALDSNQRSKYCWTFFSIDLGSVKPGKHVIVSRATDIHGYVQPSWDDDEIALKKTYWEAYQQWPREIQVEA